MASKHAHKISHLAKMAISKKLNPGTGADWRQFAGHLKFTDLDIQNFEHRNGNRPDYNPTVEVLRQWEQRFSHSPPLPELIDILRAMERIDTIGVIDDMLNDGTFWDVPNPSSLQHSHSRNSSGSGGSPSSRVVFPPPSFTGPISSSIPPADDVFHSDLSNKEDSRREPEENSYGSLDSTDHNYHGESAPQPLPPDFQERVAPHNSQNQSVRPKTNNANSIPRGPPFHGNPVFLSSPVHTSPQKSQQETKRPSGGNIPMSGNRSNDEPSNRNTSIVPRGSPTKESQQSKSLPQNFKRTNSWEKTNPSVPFNTNTWPSGGKKTLTKENNNPHARKETSSSSKSIRPALHGIPGDYGGTHQPFPGRNTGDYPLDSHHQQNWSMPLPQNQYDRTASWPHDHRQVGHRGNNSNNLRDVSKDVSPAPLTCRSGIAYGVTFAWKDWKCGMDIAKKLKREGHKVEVDRKTKWYDNEEDRSRRLPNVFNSCSYIIVIITPDYEREIAGEVDPPSPINTQFIYQYMRREYERNGNENLRFIPIVDATRIQHTEEMFRQYPVDIHQYIVRLILRQGPPRPQNRGVVVERQYSMN